MSALGWVLAVGQLAGLVAGGMIFGWTVRGWLRERAQYRAWREHERIVFGTAPDDQWEVADGR
jgi:hypothetical protein